MGSICKHHQRHEPYLKQVSDNYADFCQRFGKKNVDAKLAKETSYGELAEIEAYATMKEKIQPENDPYQ